MKTLLLDLDHTNSYQDWYLHQVKIISDLVRITMHEFPTTGASYGMQISH